MLKVYGSMLCPDCSKCREDLDRANVEYEYLDFGQDLRNLKAFLAIRESAPIFDTVRSNGSIGIPCIVTEDGTVMLTWDAFL